MGTVNITAIHARRRWAYRLIHRVSAPPPQYGTAEWLALAEGSPEKVAAVVIAAESWAQAGDTLEDDLRRELQTARLEDKRADDEDYAARADAHRRRYSKLPTTTFLQRRQAQLADAHPKAGDFSGVNGSAS